jgi:quinol monooxygenase YgiN
MYVRVTTITFDPAQEAAILQIIDDQMIPALQQLPGFHSYTGGIDRTTGRGVAISLWDNMDHAQGLRAALGRLIQQFEAASVRFDPAQLFEVVKQV